MTTSPDDERYFFQTTTDQLTKTAQDYANKCVFEHSNNGYGECLYIYSAELKPGSVFFASFPTSYLCPIHLLIYTYSKLYIYLLISGRNTEGRRLLVG